MSNDDEGKIAREIKGLSAGKQGVLIIVISSLVFFSTIAINGSYSWSTTYGDSVGGMTGVPMKIWAIISFIGVAIGILRIFVFNKKRP